MHLETLQLRSRDVRSRLGFSGQESNPWRFARVSRALRVLPRRFWSSPDFGFRQLQICKYLYTSSHNIRVLYTYTYDAVTSRTISRRRAHTRRAYIIYVQKWLTSADRYACTIYIHASAGRRFFGRTGISTIPHIGFGREKKK